MLKVPQKQSAPGGHGRGCRLCLPFRLGHSFRLGGYQQRPACLSRSSSGPGTHQHPWPSPGQCSVITHNATSPPPDAELPPERRFCSFLFAQNLQQGLASNTGGIHSALLLTLQTPHLVTSDYTAPSRCQSTSLAFELIEAKCDYKKVSQ